MKMYIFLGVAAAGIIAVSFILGSILSNPVPGTVGSPPAELPAEAVTFHSQSGSLLSGWFIPGKKDSAAILLLHGLRASRLSMLERALFLHRAGYSVLLFDFQAHGESPGERITFGHLEARDAAAAFAYLQQRAPNQPLGVIGVSLGGASALMSPISQQADAMVLEAVYTKFHEATANRIALRLGSAGRYLTPILLWQVKPRLGFDPYQLNPIEHIAAVAAPLFIIAGNDDQHTTLAESQALFAQAPEPKTFWPIEGAGHEDFHDYAQESYEERVLSFLEGYLKN